MSTEAWTRAVHIVLMAMGALILLLLLVGSVARWLV